MNNLAYKFLISSFSLLLFMQNVYAELSPSKVKHIQFQIINELGVPIKNRNYLIAYTNTDLNLAESFVGGGSTDKNGATEIVDEEKEVGVIFSSPIGQEFNQVTKKCFYQSQKQQKNLQPKFDYISTKEYMKDDTLFVVITEQVSCEYDGV